MTDEVTTKRVRILAEQNENRRTANGPYMASGTIIDLPAQWADDLTGIGAAEEVDTDIEATQTLVAGDAEHVDAESDGFES